MQNVVGKPHYAVFNLACYLVVFVNKDCRVSLAVDVLRRLGRVRFRFLKKHEITFASNFLCLFFKFEISAFLCFSLKHNIHTRYN